MDLSKFTAKPAQVGSPGQHHGMIHRIIAVHDVGYPVPACPHLRKFIIGAVRWKNRPWSAQEEREKEEREEASTPTHRIPEPEPKPRRTLWFEQKYLDIEIYPDHTTELHRLLLAIGNESRELDAIGANKSLLDKATLDAFCLGVLQELRGLIGTHLRIYIQNNRWTDISTVDTHDGRVRSYMVSDVSLKNNPVSWNAKSHQWLNEAGIQTGMFV